MPQCMMLRSAQVSPSSQKCGLQGHWTVWAGHKKTLKQQRKSEKRRGLHYLWVYCGSKIALIKPPYVYIFSFRHCVAQCPIDLRSPMPSSVPSAFSCAPCGLPPSALSPPVSSISPSCSSQSTQTLCITIWTPIGYQTPSLLPTLLSGTSCSFICNTFLSFWERGVLWGLLCRQTCLQMVGDCGCLFVGDSFPPAVNGMEACG